MFEPWVSFKIVDFPLKFRYLAGIVSTLFNLSERISQMAQKLSANELVTFKELLMANSVQTDALAQLMIDRGNWRYGISYLLIYGRPGNATV